MEGRGGEGRGGWRQDGAEKMTSAGCGWPWRWPPESRLGERRRAQRERRSENVRSKPC
jgi:hypothetical protein